jgi:multiple sugar transport system permease protein
MMAIVLTFGVWPIIKSIQMSFTDKGTSLSLTPVYIGFKNYVDIFSDPYFWNSLWITVRFTLVSVPANVLFACFLALLLGSRSIRRGSVFFKLSVFLPVVVPIIATSVIWKWMYNTDFGAINAILTSLGLPRWGGLARKNTVLWSLGIVELWKHVGLYTVIFITNLQLIDVEMYEAAYMEGANYPQRVWHVTIPELRPAFTLNFIYATIQFLKTFAVALVMSQGGPNFASNFLSYYAYTKFRIAEYGQATAMGTVLFIVVVFASLFLRSIAHRGNEESLS